MVPFVVSRLLLIIAECFLLLGREALSLDALIFCLLGFLLFFLQGWGQGVYACVYFLFS